jgi:hypothetical protein
MLDAIEIMKELVEKLDPEFIVPPALHVPR